MVDIPSDLKLRKSYFQKVLPYIGKNIIKVFTGQRRVGKSYFIFEIIEYITKNDVNSEIIYINKEDLHFSLIKTHEDLNNYVLKHKTKNKQTYLFIDEIQDIENFQIALRSLLLIKNIDIYCTGSNANLLSGDIAGHLSGRFIEINIYSLSYLEFLDFHDLTNSSNSLDLYLKYGGLPYLKHLALKDDIVFDYLKNIYNTIAYRDIVNRYAVRNTFFLEQLIQFLASNIGSLFSSKKISDYLKSLQINIPPNQVQLYISHFESAFLIHRVKRYDISGKRIFEISDKFYFENIGIRNGIWGYRVQDRGKILENIVFNHLIFCGNEVTVGNIEKYEIDFIAARNGEIQYFQVALSLNNEDTIQREFGNLKMISDNFPKTVITMDKFDGNTFDGIKTIDLKSFLSQKW